MNVIILSAILGVIMMYTGVMSKNKSTARYVATAGILALIGANWLEFAGVNFFNIDTRGMLEFTSFGLVFNLIILVCTLVYFLLSGKDLEEVGANAADYFALIFFILTGIAIVSAFKTMLMLFIGIEIISIPLYILAGSDKKNLRSNEAALKYFLMGSFSTGLMLMGIALLYGATGTFYTDGMYLGLGNITVMKMAGLVLLMISLGFKVSAVPFHFWTPDVYDGSPTVFTSFMATIVKAAFFIAFLLLFENAFGRMHSEWQFAMALITAATLIIGNITAVFQQSVKRMLAYSSIAQAGFMLLAIFALNNIGKQGLILYTAAYSLPTIGIFAVLMRMKDYTYEGFNGFAKHQPLLAALLAVFLFSLAGIPLTGGFFAKYYMLVAAMKNGAMFWLVIIGVCCAAISVYYYFRIIQAMYFREGADPGIQVSEGFKTVLVLTAVLVIILGVHPDWLLHLLDN
ncbi:NADH-quinone oxidoreductase subunit N [Pollutibacter soli]|uniref:NADH-quinone oxidoreductase subunit N n=1 Tax=Pollutibacter soli TaxID=3034157 RepID=UPI0030137F7C